MSRTWLITGVNSGFGRKMTEQLLAGGDRVAGTARRLNEVDDLKSDFGDQFWLTPLDVTDVRAVHKVVDRAFADLGRIDVIVSNAGYGLSGAVEELSDDQINHQLATNVRGSIQLVKAALPHLRAQGGGRILQLSSMGGQIALPGLSLYHATKWAMEGFFEATAQDIASFNIQTTLVEPGGARTDFGFRSMVHGSPIAAYEDTPVGVRRHVRAAGQYKPVGDAAKMVSAMIASVDREPAPKRLTLGSDAYTLMHKALTERLAALEAQKDLAFSTDAID
jgi:NAD(P)-dependent dehydrogenase (short-subunit alcohol dehydrogenase family)